MCVCSNTGVAFCNQVAVCFANVCITFETCKTCLIVSRGTELASLPFLPLYWGESGQGSGGGLQTPHQTARGWCAGKVLAPLN